MTELLARFNTYTHLTASFGPVFNTNALETDLPATPDVTTNASSDEMDVSDSITILEAMDRGEYVTLDDL